MNSSQKKCFYLIFKNRTYALRGNLFPAHIISKRHVVLLPPMTNWSLLLELTYIIGNMQTIFGQKVINLVLKIKFSPFLSDDAEPKFSSNSPKILDGIFFGEIN